MKRFQRQVSNLDTSLENATASGLGEGFMIAASMLQKPRGPIGLVVSTLGAPGWLGPQRSHAGFHLGISNGFHRE